MILWIALLYLLPSLGLATLMWITENCVHYANWKDYRIWDDCDTANSKVNPIGWKGFLRCLIICLIMWSPMLLILHTLAT